MNDYEVAIVSHARPQQLADRTLKTLRNGNVDPARIRVFVTPGQEDDYRSIIDPSLLRSVETGGAGLANNRNAINRYYPEGTPVVELDDDVLAIQQMSGDSLANISDIGKFFTDAFTIMSAGSATLWGVYPVANAYFMKPRVSEGLLFCIGHLHGFLNRPSETMMLNYKQDYEKSLMRYVADGEVIRFDMVCAKVAPMRSGSGGNTANTRTEENERDVQYLIENWPQYVKPTKRRPDGYLEVRLLNPRRGQK